MRERTVGELDCFGERMLPPLNKPSGWRTRQMVLLVVVLSLLIELLTAAMRFGLGSQAASPSDLVKTCTLGLRVHHLYLGAVCLLLAVALRRRLAMRNLLVVIGAALVLSDLAHHFLVLWPITGHHEFYFVYPELY